MAAKPAAQAESAWCMAAKPTRMGVDVNIRPSMEAVS